MSATTTIQILLQNVTGIKVKYEPIHREHRFNVAGETQESRRIDVAEVNELYRYVRSHLPKDEFNNAKTKKESSPQ